MQSLLSLLFLFTSTQTILNQQANKENLRYFDYVDIVYREERGANEDWRFSDYPFYQVQAQKRSLIPTNARNLHEARLKEQRIEYLQEAFPNEYDIHKTITHINGQELYRELDYFYPKDKIIIHHSAMPTKHISTQTGMIEHIKEIQKLHTFYRDWGDIGYHFLIDKFGNIYEGRAGGPGIIGAHTQFNNFDSIGINLLGNFQEEEPSLEQIKSLIKLLISLTRYYHLDLNQKTLYHAKSDNAPYLENFYDTPISYHKKVGQTACPGAHMLDKIPFIENFLNTYLLTFNKRQNHDQIIDEIFKELGTSTSQQEIEDHLLYFQRVSIPLTKGDKGGLSTPSVIIAQRNTNLIFPDNTTQEEILNKYNTFLTNLAQDTSISETQREYFISIFNKFIQYEQLFVSEPTDNHRDLFYLYTRKLLLNIKSLAN